MNLQTKVDEGSYPIKFSYSDKILFLGSCFANEIGSIMKDLRFNVLVNPFGVLYNPASISASLERVISGRPFVHEDVIKCDDIYKSLYHSSEFAAMSEGVLLENINRLLDVANRHFTDSKLVVVSLGTRWIYRLKSSGSIVANCQKLPQNKFDREALTVEEVVSYLSPAILENPKKIWLFTVSPIRHWKDGAHGNQLSKAVLLLAIEKLKGMYKNVLYFPAYEILLDELRDYRFYADDMLHPSQQAIDHIWQFFNEKLIDDASRELMKIVSKLNSMVNHRPFFPESLNYIAFEKECKELEKQVQEKLNKLQE